MWIVMSPAWVASTVSPGAAVSPGASVSPGRCGFSVARGFGVARSGSVAAADGLGRAVIGCVVVVAAARGSDQAERRE